MDVEQISWLGLGCAFALLLIPIGLSHFFQLKMIRSTLWSVGRMSIQLFLVGIFLEFIFQLNHAGLNVAWLCLMIGTAIMSALSSVKIKLTMVWWPLLIAFSLPTILVLLYFNAMVVQLTDLFEARYLIALGGMLLGNVLSVNIVALNNFFQDLKTQQKFYLYRLGMGATLSEALLPFFRRSFQLSLMPALAKTATMGIVSLPGMMTGQILGGSSPFTAINYQIAIMIAIYVAGALSVLVALLLSVRSCFTDYGVLREGIFKGD